MTIRDAEDYYNKLVSILQSNNFDIEMNRDRVHNSVIMSFVLEKSNSICMYCGEMSVFRKPFYEYIIRDNHPDLGDFLKKKLSRSMSDFINRDDTDLQIILEKKMTSIPDDLIFEDDFLEAVKVGKIKISYLNPDIVFNNTMSHFSFTSRTVRMEKDKKEHTAIFSVNAPTNLIEDYKSHFNNLKAAAISLVI